MNEPLIIADCETDNLLADMTRLWVLQIGTPDGDDVTMYGDVEHCDAPLAEGVERMRTAEKVVFHNGYGFDMWAINRFFPGTLRFEQIVDTLVLARMTHITERNHSLEAWGSRTGTLKGSFKGPYDTWTKDFADYSRQDIAAGRALWHKVKHGLEWGGGSVYGIEAKAAYAVALQEQHGFAFDVEKAQELHAELAQEVADLERQLAAIFPAFQREETFIPKATNSRYGYVKGVPFTKRWEDAFNPSSRQKIAEALIRDGWEPVDFTETGQAKVDEETLLACKHEGAQLLVTYLRNKKTLGAILGQGKNAKGYLQLVKPTGRIHGRVNTLGAVTWRMAHSNPNTANVSKDKRVRSLFIATPAERSPDKRARKLVGCDGAEIQARFLAHYLHRYDDGAYAERLLKGRKEDGTDGHTLNLRALEPFGLVSRDGSKTALYARIFGARAPRMWQTINEDRVKHGKAPWPKSKMHRIGQGAIDALGRSMFGLNELISDVQATGKDRGWLKGIGGAQVPVSALHSALVSLLQHGEAVAMKLALGIFEFEFAQPRGLIHGVDYGYCSNVHDEVQFECLEELAEELGAQFSECIAEAGRRLGTRCPLKGEAKIGINWLETH
jgi:DNA polymerase I